MLKWLLVIFIDIFHCSESTIILHVLNHHNATQFSMHSIRFTFIQFVGGISIAT